MRLKTNIKNLAAFTLIEMIIYLAIFSVLMTSVVGILVYSDKGNKIALQQQIIQNVKVYLSSHLQDAFINSNRIDNPTTANSGVSSELTLAQITSLTNSDVGTGADGAVTVSSTINLNNSTLVSGRSCADAANFSVTALTSTSATLSSTPSSGCLNTNDEILLINLKGISTNYTNVGNYETLRVSSVAGSTVNFSSSKIKYYGNGASDDTNIGTATTNQRVMLQRVPNYTTVTINNGANVTVNAWDGTKGGVVFFRANQSILINSGGKIDVSSMGYRNLGTTYDTNTDGPGLGGETYNGWANNGCNYNGSYLCPDDTEGTINPKGHEGGGGGGANNQSPVAGTIGGGGGGAGWNFGWQGGRGGAAGYGTVGQGANPGSGATGGTGSTGTAGNGGGGGTYGDQYLADLMLGSAGGFGDASGGSGCPGGINSCLGGFGGGIIALFSNYMTINGQVLSTGGTSTYGGGGAGGSILLKANNAAIGTNFVQATGGASFYTGGAGRIAIYAGTLSGTTNPASTTTQPLSYYDYQLINNQILFYKGSGPIPSPCTTTTCKLITNSDYIKINSMSFNLLKNTTGVNIGARVSIVLQGNYYENVQGTMQTEYTLQ